jgi:NitT/TauT family transport system permease protein
MAKGSETVAGAEAVADNLALESESTSRSQRRGVVWGLRLAVLAIFLAVWQIISGPIISTFFISRPSGVMNELWNLISSGLLLRNLPVTLEEATVGYLAGGLLAILLGVLFGRVRLLGEVFEPFVVAFFSIPKLAIAPLIILWFGIGFNSKVVLAALLTFYMTFWNTYAGVQKVETDLLNVVLVMGASRKQLMREVIFPSSIGWILVGLRMSVPYALMGAVVGEIMAGNRGLGYLVQFSASQFNTAGVFAVLVVLCLLGSAVNQAVAYLGRRSQKWNTEVG